MYGIWGMPPALCLSLLVHVCWTISAMSLRTPSHVQELAEQIERHHWLGMLFEPLQTDFELVVDWGFGGWWGIGVPASPTVLTEAIGRRRKVV